ncbi:spore maturation protein [Geosporobacter ferrireducens]|uniref:Spore maturation protein n=1 Tax=Geosporobacter ferrireducens TaxID=1424294 RepID=A0A1D8GH83_9FIRM|nr:nucleoside recognition domain-containing protein [Geosporobacter ferrireducens]AOT70277.1 spore maturation protein [Geosporobacter ferrireducens]MTI55760.1 spore maturation protein [Geosporobacter ferrireducens]
MIKILSILSIGMIPAMITLILIHGVMYKINLYDAFVEGAGEGFKTALRIMPYLIAIFFAVGIFRESGAMDLFTQLLAPVTNLIGIPKEVLPLVVMRPISGSGALGIVQDLIRNYGPDSFIGRVAATMMGSAETIFYTMGIYFGAVAVKNTRHTLSAALVSHLAAVIASVILCTIVFG